ncbi:MAG: hypothetical protein NC177_08910 [Ruminococcus flavefaciens]|nr:hypothetical protein [Ruminococcus flavefaciens]
MGQDTYIEATIYEKSTGRRISEEWFTVYWDCHDTAVETARAWTKILSKYVDTSSLATEYEVVFPQTALREMASCLFSYAMIPESVRHEYSTIKGFWDVENRGKINDIPYKQKSERFYWIEWDDIQDNEENFLRKALRLREFICELDRIHYENKYTPLPASRADGLEEYGNIPLPDRYITDIDDLRNYKKNPQAYEWKFRFVDSY